MRLFNLTGWSPGTSNINHADFTMISRDGSQGCHLTKEKIRDSLVENGVVSDNIYNILVLVSQYPGTSSTVCVSEDIPLPGLVL